MTTPRRPSPRPEVPVPAVPSVATCPDCKVELTPHGAKPAIEQYPWMCSQCGYVFSVQPDGSLNKASFQYTPAGVETILQRNKTGYIV